MERCHGVDIVGARADGDELLYVRSVEVRSVDGIDDTVSQVCGTAGPVSHQWVCGAVSIGVDLLVRSGGLVRVKGYRRENLFFVCFAQNYEL